MLQGTFVVIKNCTPPSSFKKGDDKIYLVDSGTTKVLGKVVIKLTTGKSLQLNDVLYISIVWANLICVALLVKAGIKVSFKSYKIIMTNNNIFCGKGLL